MWSRVWDRIKGRIDGLLNKNYFDGVTDHSIAHYRDHLQKYTENFKNMSGE